MSKKLSANQSRTVTEFLGSAHVFVSALMDVMEQKVIEQVSGGKLTFEQLKVLQLVAKADRHNVSDVSAFMQVSNAAASKMVDKLVRKKFLRRGEGAADRRHTHLFLTNAGARLLTVYEARRLEATVKLLESMPLREIRNLSGTLDKLSARIVNHAIGADDVCLQCGIRFRERCVLGDDSGDTCTYMRRRRRRTE